MPERLDHAGDIAEIDKLLAAAGVPASGAK
jgi:hypothetical protein